MEQKFELEIQRQSKKQRRRKLWAKVLGMMACVVVFCTTYALILPAITQESEVFCGMEAHTHTEECYEEVLICGQEAGEVHTHTAECYTQQKTLTCTLEETEGHTHTEECIVTERALTCGQEEAEAHAHSDACYDESGELICGLAETEGHTHSDACYTETTTYVCGLTETEGHTHSDACYSVTETLTCGQEETQGHVHTEECYEEQLVCELTEHEHDLSCYSNPEADLETAADWEATVPDRLSGEYTVDILAVAKSQLGYQESENNYIVTETGATKGYTRYGAWYGDPYGDWCAMFVSFCLEYGQVEGFPLDANCQNWIDTLQDLETRAYQEDPDNYHEYYAAAQGYEPVPGDIIFFNLDDSPASDHVGIVVTYTPATEHTPAQVKTIEGNSGNKVQYVTYEASDDSIMGYGRLPEQYFYCGYTGHVHDSCNDCGLEEHIHSEDCLVPPTEAEAVVPETLAYYCQKEAHTHSEECYDGSGALVCGLEEHIHTEECLTSPLHICGYVEHTHGEACYDETGALICEKEEHRHVVECFSDQKVGYVILEIEPLPTYDEIMATMEEYEAAEDYEGEEAWYSEVVEQVTWAYEDYKILKEAQQEQVYNRQKLLDLEFIWSVSTLIDEITSDQPTTVASASTSDFVNMNLYDYGSNINTLYNNSRNISYTVSGNTKYTSYYPGFQWNGGAYMKSSYDRHEVDAIDFGNSMITDGEYTGTGTIISNGKNASAVDVAVNSNYSYTINSIDVSNTYGVTNRPIGMSLNNAIGNNTYDVLQRTLGTDGYPALKNGTSLSYLFSDNTYATKQNTASIDGLFQQDPVSGAYYYNSRENHAQYGNNRFTLYNQIITPNFIVYPFGNFLPLNDITNGSNATQVSKITGIGTYVQKIINSLWPLRDTDKTASQLIDMLAAYRKDLQSAGVWSTWDAADAIRDYFTGDGDHPSDDTSLITDSLLGKMYNIDWDVDTNFFFGMDMSMNFFQPKDGMTGNDTNNDGVPDYPMEFYFTGDDDVWVYIDDVLFLDLSGIHRHVGGEIDFVNGKVYYYYLDTANTGDVSTTPYKTYTFSEILSAANKSTDGLNSKGTFKDYSTHTFKFYYMERGSGSSVCRLNFNFPLLRQNSISVSKELASDSAIQGNPDFKFQVLKADASGNKTSELFIAPGTSYTIYDESDNQIGTGTTDASGIFTLKAGQRAEFTGIQENAGKYYVRELLDGTVMEQYGNVTVSGESTTTSNNIVVGSDTFTGMDSPVKDMSDGATAFRFTNAVDEARLGTLNISKQLTEYSKTRTTTNYDIQVTLDGELLPVGTQYTVGGEIRTVSTAGIISIAADETATIQNILAGTAFTVQETSGSAQGYTVTYTDSGGYTIVVNDGVASGIIKTDANVQLVVTNSEKGTTVTIPGTKALMNPDGTEHTYTFQLDEVTDAAGETPKEGGISNYTTTATVTNDPADFKFEINYAQVNVGELPATFYYRIIEVAGADAGIATGYDGAVYVVAVTVSEATDGISAAVTGTWKDGVKLENETVSFTNTLLSSLSLTKQVVNGGSDQTFTFTVTLEPGDSGGTLPASYCVIFRQQDDTERTETITLNGQNQLVLSGIGHGQTAVIQGIPIGTKWTITETAADGYSASYNIDGTTTEGITVSGSITQDGVLVTCTNTAGYELPQTGGTGTTLYTLGGLLLMAAAGILLLYNHKRRRKEDPASS